MMMHRLSRVSREQHQSRYSFYNGLLFLKGCGACLYWIWPRNIKEAQDTTKKSLCHELENNQSLMFGCCLQVCISIPKES